MRVNLFSLNTTQNLYFWQLVTRFNQCMKLAIEGPNCIDPNNCKGDCCSIKIDVPRVLAEEYIKRGYATEEDFIRSDTFAFQLKFNEKTGKCFLFNPKINGCSIHHSGIKPIQCWIYPTGFSTITQKTVSCKKLAGWKIIDQQKAKEAERILKIYVFLCNLEAKKELRDVNLRISSGTHNNNRPMTPSLIKIFRKTKPYELAGIRDKWASIDILPAEGLSLQMKRFCKTHNPECPFVSDNFFECKAICEFVSNKLYDYILTSLYKFIKMNGPDSDGEYSLLKLLKFKPLN